MKELKFIRKGAFIHQVGGTEKHDPRAMHYEHVSHAKRVSRELQMEYDGALGRGVVRVRK